MARTPSDCKSLEYTPQYHAEVSKAIIKLQQRIHTNGTRSALTCSLAWGTRRCFAGTCSRTAPGWRTGRRRPHPSVDLAAANITSVMLRHSPRSSESNSFKPAQPSLSIYAPARVSSQSNSEDIRELLKNIGVVANESVPNCPRQCIMSRRGEGGRTCGTGARAYLQRDLKGKLTHNGLPVRLAGREPAGRRGGRAQHFSGA